jgi:hypothetical protein
VNNIKRDMIAQLKRESLYTFELSTQNNAEITKGLYESRGFKCIIVPTSMNWTLFVKAGA